MPRGRSTFTKRQKEQARQQKQRDKAERRNQRKQDKPEVSPDDEMRELREHAEAQAALFRIGSDEADSDESALHTSEEIDR
ncbi:MAG TPA: hypothetical protein VGZ28_04045 [Terriglobales bacterium]|jgi:hypothetical protein|nr:hypothetical protein [Terriglobales bacterium]